MEIGSTSPGSQRRTDRIGDVVDGVKAYARQETIEPIRGAARWVAVGALAATFLGLAVVFLALGVLRMTQALSGELLDDSWSFVPYVVTLVAMTMVVALSFSRISRRSLQKGQ